MNKGEKMLANENEIRTKLKEEFLKQSIINDYIREAKRLKDLVELLERDLEKSPHLVNLKEEILQKKEFIDKLRTEFREEFWKELEEHSAGILTKLEYTNSITINEDFLKQNFENYIILPQNIKNHPKHTREKLIQDYDNALEEILKQIAKKQDNLFNLCQNRLAPLLSKWSDEEKEQFKAYSHLDLSDDENFYDIFKCYALWEYKNGESKLKGFIGKGGKPLQALVEIDKILKENLSLAERCFLFYLVFEQKDNYQIHSNKNLKDQTSNEMILCWLMTKWGEFIENFEKLNYVSNYDDCSDFAFNESF